MDTTWPPGSPWIVVRSVERQRRHRERKQIRGCRAGLLARLRKQPNTTPLPSLLLSLANRMNKKELQLETSKSTRDCCLSVAQLLGCTIHRQDPNSASGENRGGGLTSYVHNDCRSYSQQSYPWPMSVSVNTSIWQLIFLSNQSSMAYLRCTSLQKVFQNVYHSEHWLSYWTSIQFCWFPNQTISWKAPFISKDTGDFITQLSKMSFNSDELLLATMDIASLYTNIPHSSGLSAPSFFLMLGQVKFPLLTS